MSAPPSEGGKGRHKFLSHIVGSDVLGIPQKNCKCVIRQRFSLFDQKANLKDYINKNSPSDEAGGELLYMIIRQILC